MFLYRVTFVCSALLLLVPHVNAQEADKNRWKTAYLDAESAGADFHVQGEYVGSIEVDGGIHDLGIQVIALGDGNFRAVVYRGGLPGDGWDGNADARESMNGRTDGDVTRFSAGNKTAAIEGDELELTINNDKVGTLKKVLRESETLGAEPPKGAVVLFDGSSVDGFENGRMTDDGLLMHGTTSKETFGDCKIHLEFQLSYMPYAQGQRRSNSGVYVQARYECQVLDSFGLDGKNNECGGVYGIAAPSVNMCFPPLSWQTYDIDFTAAKFDDAGKLVEHARMTVLHNGVKIHENLKLPRSTAASPKKIGPEAGPLYLQDHNNPVHYRNIWIEKK